MVIVDNCITSFMEHLKNGIPVPSFYGESDDDTFLHLIPFLKLIADADNLQEELDKRLGLENLYYEFVQNTLGDESHNELDLTC